MDRLKFKFWDEDDSQMLTVNHIYGLNNPIPLHGYSQTALIVDCSGPSQRDKLLISVEKIEHLLQSTGRKDKNKKLMFVGDIVKSKSGYLYTVVFQDNEFCTFSLRFDRMVGGKTMTSFHSFIGEFEIIGDIYRTPHLLKEQ